MNLNLTTLAYLFLRLAPFILVCFFSMSSIFNHDFKGIIYLAGLLFACATNLLIGNILVDKMPPDESGVCSTISAGIDESLYTTPMSQCILSYTFWYLFYTIYVHNLMYLNIPTLIFFPTLIISDSIWNINNGCYSPKHLFVSFIAGGLIGTLWAYIIDLAQKPEFQYFTSTANLDVCSRPSKSTFRCNVYKNGKVINSIAVPETPTA